MDVFVGALIGCMLFFGGIFIFIGVQFGTKIPERGAIMAACLHPAAAFGFGTLGRRADADLMSDGFCFLKLLLLMHICFFIC